MSDDTRVALQQVLQRVSIILLCIRALY